MLKNFTIFIALIYSSLLLAQSKNHINYWVKPLALGAKKIEVVFDLQLPKPNKHHTSNTSGIIDFSLQIVNKNEANNLDIKGQEIAFFIEKITITDPQHKSTLLTLPKGLELKDKLPDNKAYRLSHKYNNLLLLNPKQPSYEKKIAINANNNILDIGGDSKKSNFDITFLNRPRIATRGTNIMLEAKITNLDSNATKLPNIKFEIHVVDKKEVHLIEDVKNQRLVSSSEEGVTILKGASNYSFKLKTPEVPSKFLPPGKTYRVRLLNDSDSNSKAYPFPHELIVTKSNHEKGIYSDKDKVSISPNPVKDYLIVNSKNKSKSYKIYDISGALVKEQQTIRRIMVSDLKPGVYLLATDYGVTRFTKK